MLITFTTSQKPLTTYELQYRILRKSIPDEKRNTFHYYKQKSVLVIKDEKLSIQKIAQLKGQYIALSTAYKRDWSSINMYLTVA